MTFTDYLYEVLEDLSAKGTFGLEDIKEVIRHADYSKVDEFGEISAFSDKATTVLYSGGMESGVKTQDFVLALNDVRVIDHSVAGKCWVIKNLII